VRWEEARAQQAALETEVWHRAVHSCYGGFEHCLGGVVQRTAQLGTAQLVRMVLALELVRMVLVQMMLARACRWVPVLVAIQSVVPIVVVQW
jgi:hypothetical protein